MLQCSPKKLSPLRMAKRYSHFQMVFFCHFKFCQNKVFLYMNVCLLVYLEFKGGQYFTCLFLARNSFFDHRKKERKSIFLTFAVGFYTPIFFSNLIVSKYKIWGSLYLQVFWHMGIPGHLAVSLVAALSALLPVRRNILGQWRFVPTYFFQMQ